MVRPIGDWGSGMLGAHLRPHKDASQRAAVTTTTTTEDQRARSRAQEPRTHIRARDAEAHGARTVPTPQYRAQTHEELMIASLQLRDYGAAPNFPVVDTRDRK